MKKEGKMAKERFFRGIILWLRSLKEKAVPPTWRLLDGYPRQIRVILKAIDLFLQFDREVVYHEELARRIKECERECDNITCEINVTLDKNFITPIDRDDIARLAGLIDDIMDNLEKAASRLVIYQVGYDSIFFGYLKQILNLLRAAVGEFENIFQLLPGLRQVKKIRQHCLNVHHFEEEVDSIYRCALRKLAETEDPLLIIFWQDIFAALEHSMDRCHIVAKEILGVLSREAL